MAVDFVLGSLQNAALSSSLGVLRNIAGCTLMTWINPSSTAGTEKMMLYFSTGASATNARAAITMRMGTGFRMSARRLDANSVSSLDGTTVPTVGALRHVCGVCEWTNQIMRMYVDGVQENSLSISGWTGNSSDTDSSAARMAGRAASDSGTNIGGILDDPRVYNRALTAQEIEIIFNSRGRDSIVNGMVERWKLQHAAVGVGMGTAPSIGSNQGGAVSVNTPLIVGALNVSTRRGGWSL